MISGAPILGKRRRGRQGTRWKDSGNRDMESVGLKVEDAEEKNRKLFRRSQMMENPREEEVLVYKVMRCNEP